MSDETQGCGKPGPCGWCDSLQVTDDLLWFREQRDEEYDGEAHDRGVRLANEVERLCAELAALRGTNPSTDSAIADLDAGGRDDS